MMPPIVALVGRPDGGKTTLLERLIPELTRRGYRVGTIKHHIHAFAFDTPGKDTWRHKQAGAATVLLASPTGLGLVSDSDRDLPPEELALRYFTEVDFILCEGYKQTGLPKIEVFRREVHEAPLDRDGSWIAYVSDAPPNAGLPCFAPADVAALADFLVARFLTGRSRPQTRLIADGVAIPLNRFVEDFLRRSVAGMVSSLRGCEQVKRLTLTIDLEPPAED
ncbi:MAG: molybdopterin-guanine dinucleotide biosynthesis protein B [Thermodesulfobacteriota bacterium]